MKKRYKALVEKLIGIPCPSGLNHRINKNQILLYDKYCYHKDCELLCYQNALEKIEADSKNFVFDCDGYVYQGRRELIDKISNKLTQLELVKSENIGLKENNNKAFEQGCIQGRAMELQKIRETLIASRQILLDKVLELGIIEYKIPQFVDWYENKRNASVNPRQDILTYKMCRNILDLSKIIENNEEITN